MAPFVMPTFMSFYRDSRPEQKRFYASKAWRRCREVYLSEHPLCERCLAVGIVSSAEHVHHKIELQQENYKDPEIALNPDNLEALCFKCHQLETHGIKEVGDDYFFDENGNIQHVEGVGGHPKTEPHRH